MPKGANQNAVLSYKETLQKAYEKEMEELRDHFMQRLAEKQRQIDELDGIVDDKSQQIEVLNNVISRKDNEIKVGNLKLRQVRLDLGKLESMVSEKDRTIGDKDEQIENLEAMLTEANER